MLLCALSGMIVIPHTGSFSPYAIRELSSGDNVMFRGSHRILLCCTALSFFTVKTLLMQNLKRLLYSGYVMDAITTKMSPAQECLLPASRYQPFR